MQASFFAKFCLRLLKRLCSIGDGVVFNLLLRCFWGEVILWKTFFLGWFLLLLGRWVGVLFLVWCMHLVFVFVFFFFFFGRQYSAAVVEMFI